MYIPYVQNTSRESAIQYCTSLGYSEWLETQIYTEEGIKLIQDSKQHQRQQTSELTEIPSPYPLHLPLTCCSWFVEVTRSTVCLVHDGWRLETIGQDDVRVHGANVEMVDHGILISSRIVSQDGQLVYNSLTDLCEREHKIVGNYT